MTHIRATAAPGAGTETRPMTPSDVASAEAVWSDAFGTMRAAYNLPGGGPTTPEDTARQWRQMTHKLTADPGGSWVALDGTRVIGLAQAVVRGDVWVLSLLGVDPGYQDRGVGRQLLERALDYGERDSPGLILSSRDTRAMRRYVRAGFDLHPSLAAWGTVRPGAVTRPAGIEEAGADALGVVDTVDEAVRGASRAPDVALMIREGARLMIDGDKAYAVVDGPRIRTLAAVDEPSATRVLTAALARNAPDEQVEAGWITGSQQWAIRTLVQAGIEVHPIGAVMIRGWPGPPLHYLPNGAFG